MVGAIPWSYAPAIPPELMLLANWFPVNLYEMSSWTRGIVVPLAIVYALRPGWRLPKDLTVNELLLDPAAKPPSLRWDKRVISWKNCFLLLDRALKLYEHSPWKPLRKTALRRAKDWMMERLERSEGLGTIYPAMMNSSSRWWPTRDPSDPLLAREIQFLSRYEIEQGDTLRVQPCISPLWDTAIAMVSLEEAGVRPAHPSLLSAARWLVANQILGPGDWQVKNRNAEPGGWAFEFRNDFYPDVDDTAFVLMALSRVSDPEPARLQGAVRRGLAWLVEHAEGDGGWGAFDHENNLEFLNHIPFADHNAMLDPSTADVTARALECLGHMDWPSKHPVVERARKFLDRDQTPDGSWFGRWGVNYVYGTSGVLRALEVSGLARCPTVGARRTGCARCRIPTAVSANRSFPITTCLQSEREEHTFADRLGLDRLARGLRTRTIPPPSAPWSGCSRTRARRLLGRRGIYRNRLPLRFLFEISPVPKLFPAVCAGALR